MLALCISTCHLIDGGYGSIYAPVRKVSDKKLYQRGDFSTVRISERYYAVLWKNVIVGEFVGNNKDLVDFLFTKTKPNPKDVMQNYNYEKALGNIGEAPKWAKKYNFTIE